MIEDKVSRGGPCQRRWRARETLAEVTFKWKDENELGMKSRSVCAEAGRRGIGTETQRQEVAGSGQK